MGRVRVFPSSRLPQQYHWRILKNENNLFLDPEEFLARWRVSRSELAKICGCSVSTVKRWFASGESHHEPTPDHKRKLARTHLLWCQADSGRNLEGM
jgi:hypothetical protein